MVYTDVVTDNGILRGEALPETGVRRFLGVPYGQSTAGLHRWRPPRPAASWTGVREATVFGPAAWQTPQPPASLYYGGERDFSEDCLNLNIWTGPEGDTDRPVMVWLHLGAFQFGSAAHPMYDGEQLAARGVTMVSVNYRLGRLGFLAHADLSAESGYSGSGNYGLMDQLEALRYVQRNIAAFGGDPGNVTVFGVSAGGDSVHKLRCSPLAKGLFHKAIAQSGPGVTPAATGPGNPGYASTLAAGEEAGAELLTALGVASIEEARLLPAERIVSAAIPRAAGDWSTGAPGDPGLSVHRYDSGYPVIDGLVLVEPEERTFQEGRAADIPTIVGNVADEQSGGRFLATLELYERYLADTFGGLAAEALEVYPASTDEEARRASQALMADEVFVMSSWRAAALHSATLTAPVWHYRFVREPPLAGGPSGVTGSTAAGAFHGADVLYVFGTYADRDGEWLDLDRELSNRMQRAWVSFAATGDPTAPEALPWPAFDSTKRASMLWDAADRVADVYDARKGEFWARYRASPRFDH